MEGGVGENHHLVLEVADKGMEGIIRHLGTGIIPADHEAPLVHDID